MNCTLHVLISVLGFAQSSVADDIELARRLANPASRGRAVDEVVFGGHAKLLPLLAWSDKTPAGVDRQELYVGMMDAFGRLKTLEAVPFLLRNITIDRHSPVTLAPWLKGPEMIERSFPAISALINIGPSASRAAMQAVENNALKPEARLAAIFVVSRIRGVPEAKAFLNSVIGYASNERYRAEEGLKYLELEEPGR